MFGFFRSDEEKFYRLKDFSSWCKKITAVGYNPILFNKFTREMMREYSFLSTPEQKLFAAYTSFDPDLKDIVKKELSAIPSDQRKEAVRTIHRVFEKKGQHGYSHLLKQDYEDDFFMPSPKDWLRDVLTYNELSNYFTQMFGIDMKNHESLRTRVRDGGEWSRLINLITDDCQIREFDSGFSKGIALVKEDEIISQVTTMHYRRQK